MNKSLHIIPKNNVGKNTPGYKERIKKNSNARNNRLKENRELFRSMFVGEVKEDKKFF